MRVAIQHGLISWFVTWHAGVVQVTCGQSHSIALDDKGQAYTWGNGNYGKLGHKVSVLRV